MQNVQNGKVAFVQTAECSAKPSSHSGAYSWRPVEEQSCVSSSVELETHQLYLESQPFLILFLVGNIIVAFRGMSDMDW